MVRLQGESWFVGCRVVLGLLTRRVRIEKEYQNRSNCGGRGGFERKRKKSYCGKNITAIGGKKVVAISLALRLLCTGMTEVVRVYRVAKTHLS